MAETREPIRLKKWFHVGVNRRSVFKPVASIGVLKDAGIMISPVPVRDYGWTYGTATAPAYRPADLDHVTIGERPKLHYHRSGIAAVSLGGAELERRSLRLPPVDSVSRGQILSLVAIRPWELATEDIRRGDVTSAVATWPQSIHWTFQLLKYRGDLPIDPEFDGETPLGLIGGDDSRWFVDLSWYIPQTVLIGQSTSVYEPNRFMEPSITVAALPWSPDGSAADQGVFALWSSESPNPLVAHALSRDVLNEDEFTDCITKGNLVTASMEDHVGRASTAEVAARPYTFVGERWGPGVLGRS